MDQNKKIKYITEIQMEIEMKKVYQILHGNPALYKCKLVYHHDVIILQMKYIINIVRAQINVGHYGMHKNDVSCLHSYL